MGRPIPVAKVSRLDTNMESGSSIVLENANQCIAMQLRDDNLKWGLFGGWSELDETPQETILREIDEELGVILDPDHLTFLRIFTFPDIGTANVFHYPVKNELDNAVLTEGITFQFLSPQEISEKSVPDHHREILTWYRSQ
jgi:8-oxo-dGTP diphosphatase